MYKTIYVPVDNSDYSNQAVASAIELGKAFDAKLVGCHVYAASMHDYRFKQMEYTLPEEYLEENELDRQRRIHDSLITMGLELISDSYLEPMKQRCADEGLEFEPRMMDGKHHVEIIRDLSNSGYDLTVIGALGIGRVRDSQIGSVCERVTRATSRDVLVIRRLPDAGPAASDTILVGVDGSPQSFGALETALDLAERFGKRVEVVSVYDPYLHYSVFKGVVDVLTERAAKIFRFEEQNQLHEEIIDTGLAQIYQSHLEVAASLARARGIEVGKTLLDGKAFQKILDHARKIDPWLLVIGRVGVHSSSEESGLGSNTENLLRSSPCDLLLTTRLEVPELDVKAEESIRWTPEAEERFRRVPEQVKGIARTAIYRLAVEQGHSVISSSVLDDAMERFMPKYTARETKQLAESLALQVARAKPTWICRKCGATALQAEPVRCGACGGERFEVITPEMLDAIAAAEGGTETETTYDGRKLTWSKEARRALTTIKDAYQRRRAKARVEKTARGRKLPTVTLELARQVIEDETGVPLELPPPPASLEAIAQPVEAAEPAELGERKLIARDPERTPLLSPFDWTEEAIERLFRVPSGFMRGRTQGRIEELALERRLDTVDLALVEDGIALGRVLMEAMVRAYESEAEGAGATTAEATAGADDEAAGERAASAAGEGCPVAHAPDALKRDIVAVEAPARASAGRCPVSHASNETQERIRRDGAGLYLNEVGLMSALDRKRRGSHEEG
jgi:nucleotide-binding universal stress UspA family protein/Zn finger protein HypA/HybF involved in hydrogenase expression